MADPIRIPRTTALFVTGLGRILREHLKLGPITEHEHWTFEHVADWSECGSPGECRIHGMSPEYLQSLGSSELESTSTPFGLFEDICYYGYHQSAYLGTGRISVRSKNVDLRVRIEKMRVEYATDHDSVLTVYVWARSHTGTITKGVFGLHADGTAYVLTNKLVPDQPPRRLAFWHVRELAAR